MRAKIWLATFLSFFLSINLFCQDFTFDKINGNINEVKYFKGTFFSRYDKWELTPFFPYSNLVEGISDKKFDENNLLEFESFLSPSSDPFCNLLYKVENKTEESEKKTSSGQIVKSASGYNYLTGEIIKKTLIYDKGGRLISKKTFTPQNRVAELRKYFYSNNLDREEAYSENGTLVERVLYAYDEQNNLLSKQVFGEPYGIKISKVVYTYKENTIASIFFYGLDDILQKKIFYSYEKSNLPKFKIVHDFFNGEVKKSNFHYVWSFDERGNWIEQIEVQLKKSSDEWGGIPLCSLRREISYR